MPDVPPSDDPRPDSYMIGADGQLRVGRGDKLIVVVSIIENEQEAARLVRRANAAIKAAAALTEWENPYG